MQLLKDNTTIENNPNQNRFFFLKDADLDGRSYNAFMREAGKWASVYGAVWVFVDKPTSNAGTRAEELQQEIRPMFISNSRKCFRLAV